VHSTSCCWQVIRQQCTTLQCVRVCLLRLLVSPRQQATSEQQTSSRRAQHNTCTRYGPMNRLLQRGAPLTTPCLFLPPLKHTLTADAVTETRGQQGPYECTGPMPPTWYTNLLEVWF
jgi:hypothetical protein